MQSIRLPFEQRQSDLQRRWKQSVSYFSNSSRAHGNGCQCAPPVRVNTTDLILNLDASVREKIDSHPAYFDCRQLVVRGGRRPLNRLLRMPWTRTRALQRETLVDQTAKCARISFDTAADVPPRRVSLGGLCSGAATSVWAKVRAERGRAKRRPLRAGVRAGFRRLPQHRSEREASAWESRASFTTLCGREEDCPPSSPAAAPAGALPSRRLLDARQTLDASTALNAQLIYNVRRAARVGL